VFLTGQTGHRNGVVDNQSGWKLNPYRSVPYRLNAAGYFTCKVGKYLNNWPFGGSYANPPGWSRFVTPADNANYYNYKLSMNGVIKTFGSTPADYRTKVEAAQGRQCIDAATKADKPLYMELSFKAPHDSLVAGPEYVDTPVQVAPETGAFNEADVSDKPAWLRNSQPLSPELAQILRDKKVTEYRALRSVDDGIALIVNKLKAMGTLDNTIIVFTSDNANSYGDHRVIDKKCYYDSCGRFPLMIRYPWGPAETRVGHHLISNVDIAPTFAEIGKADVPWTMDGKSLLPILDGEEPETWRTSMVIENRAVVSADHPYGGKMWGVRTNDHLYVELDSGEKELYDLRVDPEQLDNVAADPAYAATIARLGNDLSTMKN
jgi:arylsulfatase A-like enzyme